MSHDVDSCKGFISGSIIGVLGGILGVRTIAHIPILGFPVWVPHYGPCIPSISRAAEEP